MEELNKIRDMLYTEELVPKEEIWNMYYALKAVVGHVQDTKDTGYRVDGDYLLWAINQNLSDRDDKVDD